MNNHLKILSVLLLLPLSFMANASIESEMDDFLNDVQGGSAFTSSTVYDGQAYKYYTGGRAYMRLPQQNINIASISKPHISSGCGGIDAYAGGLSHVSASELVNALKTTGGSAIAGYGFMLALRTVSSKLSNNLETVFEWADKINKFNTNSCEMAKWAINSALSKDVLGFDESNCIARRVSDMGESYTEAKENCGPGGLRRATNNTTDTKENSPVYGNITWKIIKENGLFDDDVNTQMLAMNLIGSVIISNVKNVSSVEVIDDADPTSRKRIIHMGSKLKMGDELINAMLHGGTVDIEKCTDTSSSISCQEVTPGPITITAADSFVGKTQAHMSNIYNRIVSKSTGPVATQELNFIKSTSLPVARIAAVAAAMGGTAGDSLLAQHVDTVAKIRLYDYIDSMFASVSEHVPEGKYGNQGKDFRKELNETKNFLRQKKLEKSMVGLQNAEVIQELSHYERLVMSRIPVNLNRSYLFAKGLK